MLTIVGPQEAIDLAAPRFGPVIAPTTATDFVVLGLAIFFGGLVGMLASVTIGGATIAIGTSVGALLAGLLVGRMRTRHPLFGRIPEGAVTLVPLLTGLVFGRFVLGMQSVLLLGSLAGALTMTAAMGAVQQRSQSPVAVLGYTPAYPISNILLTLWGTVIVILTVG